MTDVTYLPVVRSILVTWEDYPDYADSDPAGIGSSCPDRLGAGTVTDSASPSRQRADLRNPWSAAPLRRSEAA